MIDTNDDEAMRAEAERRQRLKAQGRTTFEESPPVSHLDERTFERDPRILEKAEQSEVRKRFVVCGFKVYNLSQARASKQTPGLPDMWIVDPERRIALWFETKRQVGGKLSEAQKAFWYECIDCRILYLSGDRFSAEAFLLHRGFATMDRGVFEPVK